MRHFITKCTTWTMLHDWPSDLSTTYFSTGFTTSAKKTLGSVQCSCDLVEVTRRRLALQLGIHSENLLEALSSEKIPQALICPNHDYLPSSTINNMRKLFSMCTHYAETDCKVSSDVHFCCQPLLMQPAHTSVMNVCIHGSGVGKRFTVLRCG